MWSQDKIQPHSQPLKLGGAINLLGASWAVAKIGLFLKMIRTCQGKWTKILQRLHKHMFCYIQNNQIFHWNVIKMRLNLLFHLNSTQLISHFYRKKSWKILIDFYYQKLLNRPCVNFINKSTYLCSNIFAPKLLFSPTYYEHKL